MTFCEELNITFYLKFSDPQPGCHYETSIGQYKHKAQEKPRRNWREISASKQAFYKVETSLC